MKTENRKIKRKEAEKIGKGITWPQPRNQPISQAHQSPARVDEAVRYRQVGPTCREKTTVFFFLLHARQSIAGEATSTCRLPRPPHHR
jgi:hypothetical protein